MEGQVECFLETLPTSDAHEVAMRGEMEEPWSH